MSRTCGTCSACCRWPAVPEVNKLADEPCRHLKNGKYGCEIYKDRPSSCAKYHCAWVRGMGGDTDQPSKCGVLIDRRDTPEGYALVAKALRPGALETKRGRNAIRRISASENLKCFLASEENSNVATGVFTPTVRQIISAHHG